MVLTGIWGSDANNVWVVGWGVGPILWKWDGKIMKWDGSAWHNQGSRTTTALSDVWGSDANDVWAVGSYGKILRSSFRLFLPAVVR